MKKLLVNVDHVATLRNARSEGYPDPVEAARICESHGAAGIVFHLREDRRHIKDADAWGLKEAVTGLLDFEMGATDEMLDICCRMKPQLCTLVPEKREEITTEGGLNMPLIMADYRSRVLPKLAEAGVPVSLFVEPSIRDMELCAELGVPVVELHTGTYANASDADKPRELKRLREAAERAHSLGIKVNAGHGLGFANIRPFLEEVPHLAEISIGHALMADAIMRGLPTSVSEMAALINEYN
ncbi:MAG: pyridoxine 5'-phosphate synthase [Candidatus Cyclonatronum sp.]|uniref:pyridoxine 5'-phosphate synthase n=1 Tax=Cyclonatronum sp. TaxID=3024185 RepID=UPI0025BCA719|nr:pyridoxine 5'-phosphate synthase [Cyclonatronum sp.]MCH8486416.1 pyridoxine 5'-phosphate synthase [Cyclonatronum sp.]